jgi:uroporphyrin-III C-methyltransferase
VSFRIVTGHEAPDKKSSQIPWETFTLDETIVFLMGLHNLDKISSKLIEIGKPQDYPCAVISKGTTKEQRVVVGTLSDIVEKAKDLPTPALIIVGQVVNLREQLQWFDK